MTATKKTEVELSRIAKKAVRTRRRKHPGGSRSHLSARAVEAVLGSKKRFSVRHIMDEFSAAVDNATAVIAILKMRGRIEKVGVAVSGVSLWAWVKEPKR